MKKSYKSETFAAIHETAQSLCAHGIIDNTTLREFDESCLVSVKDITPEEDVMSRIMARNREAYEVLAK